MSFVLGLLLGLAAGAVVGARPSLHEESRSDAPSKGRWSAFQAITNALARRLQRAQGAFAESRRITAVELEHELAAARSK